MSKEDVAHVPASSNGQDVNGVFNQNCLNARKIASPTYQTVEVQHSTDSTIVLETRSMSKRKYIHAHFYDETPEVHKKQAISSNAAQLEEPEKYAYAIMKENGGPYMDTEYQLEEIIFTDLAEANKEAKAMSRDSDYWQGTSESSDDEPDGDDIIEESFGPDGEWGIRMEGGEEDYETLWVVRRRLQATSTRAIERRRRIEEEEKRAELKRVEKERARGEGVVEYV